MEMIKSSDHYITADISVKPASALNIIILHGYNNNINYKLISDLFHQLKKEYSVLRFNFSYVDQGLKKTNVRNKAEIRACIKRLGNKNIVLIGKSYGGALSAMVAAENKFDILKVIVLGYPLHEWNNPKKIFDYSYLNRLKGKVTFLIGDNDPNCNLKLFRKLLPDQTLEIIKNSDHSYRPINMTSNIEDNEKEVLKIVERELASIPT
ncbi:alpha/beta fold hydrolase [Candidatus Marsarchaeota archaeon]|nr:alpha/beta fold hydrolase [Candidatus Marsarchaeota archaeon]